LLIRISSSSGPILPTHTSSLLLSLPPLLQEAFGAYLRKGFDIRPTIAVTKVGGQKGREEGRKEGMGFQGSSFLVFSSVSTTQICLSAHPLSLSSFLSSLPSFPPPSVTGAHRALGDPRGTSFLPFLPPSLPSLSLTLPSFLPPSLPPFSGHEVGPVDPRREGADQGGPGQRHQGQEGGREGGREGGSVCWSTRLVIRWQYFNSPSLPPSSS